MKKMEKGITLISLIVTIIVLLILSGITVSLTIGNDGLLTKSKEIGENIEQSELEAQEKINSLEQQLGYIDDGTTEEIDTNPPKITDITLIFDTETSVKVTISVTEKESGIEKIEYSIDGGATYVTPVDKLSKTHTFTGLSNNGRYNVKVKVTDLAGNYAEAEKNIIGTGYVISYDTNGGSNGPDSQVKYYNEDLILSSTTPTRTGYTFQGWSTTSTGSVAYAAGATYSGNANMKLYAVWKANTYTITYNANGGSGAPSSQTKNYGETLTLSSTKPTRTGYAFQGWSTTSTGSVAYAAGATYSGNANMNLYAVWKVSTLTVSSSDTFFGDAYVVNNNYGNYVANNGNLGIEVNASAGYGNTYSISGQRDSINKIDLSGYTYITFNVAPFQTTQNYGGDGLPVSGGAGTITTTAYGKVGGKTVQFNQKTKLSDLGLNLTQAQTISVYAFIQNYSPWSNWYGGVSTINVTSIVLE